jgi:hypothetical protein
LLTSSSQDMTRLLKTPSCLALAMTATVVQHCETVKLRQNSPRATPDLQPESMPCHARGRQVRLDSGASCLLPSPCGELRKKSEGHTVAKSRGVRQGWAGRRLGGKQVQVRCPPPVERRVDTLVLNFSRAAVRILSSVIGSRKHNAWMRLCCTTAVTTTVVWGMGYYYCCCQGLHA